MTFEKVRGMIAEQLQVSAANITPETRLVEDLKADSANVMVMIMDLEDTFDMMVEDSAITELKTVGDVVAYRHPDSGQTEFSRIVAIGENSIMINQYGDFLINGTVPAERVFCATIPLDGPNVEYPYTMRKGGYFLLDDYRTEGEDSRRFGQLLEDELLGKVVYIFRRRGI